MSESEMIFYCSGNTRLGKAVVAWSERGICALLPGEDEAALAQRFPRARLVAAPLHAWAERALRCMDEGNALDVPLDLHGTAFQQQVWRALREVPAGQTVTYAGLAARLQAPTAARAVARACASNPLAVLVPCHRVVRSDGGLGGYRWGVQRKQQLLDAERRAQQ